MEHRNLILETDSYKCSHYEMYPNDVQALSCYLEARVPDEEIVFFGLRPWIEELPKVTKSDVEEAKDLLEDHGLPFNEDGWMRIVKGHRGNLPITIYALPEGTVVNSKTPLLRVESSDLELPWIATYIETSLMSAVWYPCTVASRSRHIRVNIIMPHWLKTCDTLDGLDFALHDFGGRGVTGEQQRRLGGMAHLTSFKGTDNLSAVWAFNEYYITEGETPGFSVPASEHSVQMCFGPDHQEEYVGHVIGLHAATGKTVSIVLDGYDTFVALKHVMDLKEIIKGTNMKVMVRPDSGNPLIHVPMILDALWDAFGGTVNSHGCRVLSNCGILQGDGVNAGVIDNVLTVAGKRGFAASNIVFGSGGALLQDMTRDMYGFAYKASAMLVDDEWKPIFKSPKEDPSKESRPGRIDVDVGYHCVYDHGDEYVEYSLRGIREKVTQGVKHK